MATITQRRRSIAKPLAIGFGGLILLLALLIGAWILYILFRPTPDGFAPTAGQAISPPDAQSQALQYTIDARSREEWAYFDFSLGEAVSVPQDSLDWDVAFRRTDILTNSGDSNPAGIAGAVDLGEVTMADAIPPAAGYAADVTHEERGVENPALHKWYNYNWTSHIITSKNHTYALRTAENDTVILTFLSYYCDDGSPACVTFQYRSADDTSE
jgi:hypothetical protein